MTDRPAKPTAAPEKQALLRIRNIGTLVTGVGPLRGPLTSWEQIGLRRGWDVVVTTGERPTIVWLGPSADAGPSGCIGELDLGGASVLPGLVDAHTHAVFAGDRSGEFSKRMAGASYAELAAAGGGILTTVRQTRAATVQDLIDSAAPRLTDMVNWGARVVEIKTGYGLTVQSEVNMLAAIDGLARRFAGVLQLVPTAMPAHAISPDFRGDRAGYVDEVCARILPAMAASGLPCRFVDVFIEQGYFDVAAAERIAAVARNMGWGLKAHVDEFADVGGVRWAVSQRAASVEHLLTTSDASIACLAASATVAVCLPLTSLFLREGYAPMRKLVDAGALVAIATDCNPGSAMSTNLPLALQVAMLNGRLSPQECVRAATTTAAIAAGCPNGYDGTLQIGGPFVPTTLAIEHPDLLFYELGAPPRALPMALTDGQAGPKVSSSVQ